MSKSSVSLCDKCETVSHCLKTGCVPESPVMPFLNWRETRPVNRVPEPSSRANDIQIGGDHYKNMGVEPWDVVDTWPIEQRIGFYRGGALKYIMRMGAKDDNVQEIRKGAHYMQKLAEVLQERDDELKHQLDEGCRGA